MNSQLEKYSEDFKKKFFILFIREVMKNSNPEAFSKNKPKENPQKNLLQELKNIKPKPKINRQPTLPIPQRKIPEKNFQKKRNSSKNLSQEGYQKSIMSNNSKKNLEPVEENPQLNIPKIGNKLSENQIKNQAQILRIPQPKLPPEYEKLERFKGLRPIARKESLNLGKIEPLLKDPSVNIIESDGPGEPVKVQTNITQYSNIILTEEEIENILKEFSRASKIPLNEGEYRVVAGKYILWASYKKDGKSNFTIKKMPPPRINNIPQNNQNPQSRDPTRPNLNIPRKSYW